MSQLHTVLISYAHRILLHISGEKTKPKLLALVILHALTHKTDAVMGWEFIISNIIKPAMFFYL